MARKLKVVESNQAKASLAKPWLPTDEAKRSFVSNSPDVSRLCFGVCNAFFFKSSGVRSFLVPWCM